MIIHVVQKDDTIESIANQYQIPRERIELDNDLVQNNILNIGQAIMITKPAQTYVVKEGDTLASIAEANGISIIQILRNNPRIADNNIINVGDELVIRYDRISEISVLGYATTFIKELVLRKTLPYLTYISIFNYRVDGLGAFPDINDTRIVNLALEYGVAPIMFLSAMTETGRGSYATTHALINNPEAQNILIENVLLNIKIKGYVGVNLGFYSILEEDIPLYITFVSNFTTRLNSEGFEVFLTLTPHTMGFKSATNYNKTYYADLGNIANKVILITYLWQSGTISQFTQTTFNFIKENLEFVISQIPPEKIFLGHSRIAYDWELPYVEGETFGYALTNLGAISLANQLGTEIFFDETTQTPYFYYNTSGIEHLVWYKDARSISPILKLVEEYNLAGIAIWNINYYFSQLYFSINSQYDIKTNEFDDDSTNTL